MIHLYLIRHADYRYEMLDGRNQDLGLSEEGVQQAEKLRDRFIRTQEIKPDVLISSTLRGAHETAQMIAPAFNLPIVLDADFEEWRTDDGTIESAEFMRQWEAVPKLQKAFYRWIEEGETRIEFVSRVSLALNRVIQKHNGKTIMIVTHGAFIQMSFLYFFGMGEANIDRATPEILRASITHWFQAPDSERWLLKYSNDTHHLNS